MRLAQPTPAQFTTIRRGAPEATAVTLSFGWPPRSQPAARSTPMTVTPVRASAAAVAPPRPEAAPVTMADVPAISMGVLLRGCDHFAAVDPTIIRVSVARPQRWYR